MYFFSSLLVFTTSYILPLSKWIPPGIPTSIVVNHPQHEPAIFPTIFTIFLTHHYTVSLTLLCKQSHYGEMSNTSHLRNISRTTAAHRPQQHTFEWVVSPDGFYIMQTIHVSTVLDTTPDTRTLRYLTRPTAISSAINKKGSFGHQREILPQTDEKRKPQTHKQTIQHRSPTYLRPTPPLLEHRRQTYELYNYPVVECRNTILYDTYLGQSTNTNSNYS